MELNSDLIMQFGLMQKLSTGNSILDAILVMLLPFLFSHIVPYLQDFVSKWKNRSVSTQVTREITFTFKPGRYFDYDGDIPPNHKLQTAILMHINTLPGFQDSLVTADVKLAKVPKRKERREPDGSAGSDSESSTESNYYWYPDCELQDFELQVAPPMDEEVTLEPGLTFCRSQNTTTGTTGTGGTGDGGAAKSDETTVTFTLRGSSAAQIDGFIAAAYNSYRESIKGEKIDGEERRFLYLPVLSGAEGAKEDDFTFRAYPLTDDKDFTNFFHPDKDAILQLVNAFQNKTGKFAIKGYPHKLGFLLHGPPGTGKTTFLRALATHTKRSIINIPLSRIRTNQQLMSLMMNQQVRVEGEDYSMPLPHSKVIYVCEDVDAASHVVQKRGLQDPLAVALSSLTRPARAQAASAAAAQSAGAAWAVGPSAASKKIDVAAGTPEMPEVAPTTAAEPTASKYLSTAAMGRAKMFMESGADTLNLAGLLNVLDGVVDTPGRLLVLSTNHPEVLDPALIRPGRINRKVYMGYIAMHEALQLVSHYFGSITPQQQTSFQSVWKNGCVSPAALEALCAECDNMASLLKGVAVLVRHSAAAAVSVAADSKETTAAAIAASDDQLDAKKTIRGVPDQDSSATAGSMKSSSSNSNLGSSDAPAECGGQGSAAQDAGFVADCRVIIETECSKKGCQRESAVMSHALSILTEADEGFS